MVIRTGERFAGYELQELAGEGDTGVVYKARDLRLQRWVALRIVATDVTRDPVTRARLNRESTALASIDHPNVIPIYEVGEAEGRIFIASRWADGVNLSDMVREDGRLHPRRSVRIANQIAAALQAAHALGIIHRNVKPSNVLVTPAADHVYLTDFGLARRLDDRTGLTVQEHLLETFDYVAPEYITGGEIDGRVDIYGLGCVLYQALTAEVPYPRQGIAAKAYAHQSADPPSPRVRNPEVPGALDAVVRRAMAKDPADRQQTPAGFAFESAAAVELTTPLWAARIRGDDPQRVPADLAGAQPAVPVDDPQRVPADLAGAQPAVPVDDPQRVPADLAGAQPAVPVDDPQRVPADLAGAQPAVPVAEGPAVPVAEGPAAAAAASPASGPARAAAVAADASQATVPAPDNDHAAADLRRDEPVSEVAPEQPEGLAASDFYERKHYRTRGQPVGRLLLWAVAVLVFVAAPIALLIALLH